MRRAYDPRLLEGPIIRSLLLLALPIMGANILQISYQMVDAFWVGRLGAEAVASVSISMPIMFLMISAGMGFAIAGSTLIAQYVGARNVAMVNHVAAQTLLSVTGVSLVLGTFGFVIAPYVLALMEVAPAVFDNALKFLRVQFVGLPLAFIYFMFQSQMRGVGQVRVPLFIVAASVGVNFILDPLLIFGAGLGVMGAALATLFSQAIAASIALRLLFGGRFGVKLSWRSFRPDLGFIGRAFSLGYPASIEQSARGLGMTVMTFLITSFGTVTTASYGVGTNVLNFVVIPAMGFSMATSTLVGQNIGAGNIRRAERVALLAATLTFTALTSVGILAFAFANHVAAFFVPHDRAVIHEASIFIRTVSWSFGFIGLQFALMGVLRASGNMMTAMVISLVSQWCLQFPLAFVLSQHTRLHAHGLWWAFPAANVSIALVSAIVFARGDWKRKRLVSRDEREAEQEEIADQVVI
ncbi:MAG: MATE family efflux transporter [Alphaproteobacteria bacterium]|nr:MATE family efflux transporter [Alphaproteobacteria bacterium]